MHLKIRIQDQLCNFIAKRNRQEQFPKLATPSNKMEIDKKYRPNME